MWIYDKQVTFTCKIMGSGSAHCCCFLHQHIVFIYGLVGLRYARVGHHQRLACLFWFPWRFYNVGCSVCNYYLVVGNILFVGLESWQTATYPSEIQIGTCVMRGQAVSILQMHFVPHRNLLFLIGFFPPWKKSTYRWFYENGLSTTQCLGRIKFSRSCILISYCSSNHSLNV